MAGMGRLRKNKITEIVGAEDGISQLGGNRHLQVCNQ